MDRPIEHEEYIRTTRLRLGCTPEIEGFWGTTYFVGCVDAHEVAGSVLCVTADYDAALVAFMAAAFHLRWLGTVHSLLNAHHAQLDRLART